MPIGLTREAILDICPGGEYLGFAFRSFFLCWNPTVAVAIRNNIIVAVGNMDQEP